MATSRKPTDLPTLQTEPGKCNDTLTRNSYTGAYLGGAFGAGLAVRHSLPRTLVTSLFLVPSFAVLGFFGKREFDRRDGQRKVAELRDFGVQKTSEAHGYVSEKLSNFRKK